MTALGSYRVVADLGEGAVGRVVAAIDTRTGKHYAIKTLRDGAGDVSQRGLLDEAAVVVQLAHPNIVELVDVGRDAGSLYLVMELVRGTTLRTWVNEWPGAIVALHAFDQILDALSAAHAQGVVHGDLKPGNVLLDAQGRIKIADFGIARVIDPVRGSRDRPIGGTPFYMAPEQVFEPEDVGPPSDLYAIGVMLRQLFGQPVERPSMEQMLAAKLAKPKPFVLRDGLSAPPELATLIDGLLEPDPRRRLRFAAHVRRALALVASGISEASPVRPVQVSSDMTFVDETFATSGRSTDALSDPSLAEESAPETLVRRLRPVPLVARKDELELLRALERDVSEGGGPRALVILGRAGDGKSRIARHGFANVERSGSMVGAAASFDELGQSASVDVRACLRRLLGAPRSGASVDDTIHKRWAWLAPWLREEDARALCDLLRPDALPVAAEVTASLATTALVAASRVRPVYLWLDDVAWSRDGAMDLALRLLDTDARVLVVATVRSGTAEHPSTSAWLERIRANARATVRKLPPLANDERVALMRATGPVAEAHARALAPLLDHSTLVITEAVRDWIDEGLLAPTGDDDYAPREGVTVSMLAHHAGSALARRLDALLSSFGNDARRAESTLIHAALLGTHFEEQTLRACDEGNVDAVLDRTLLVGVLRVHGPRVYRFEHQLFAQALLDRLTHRADAAELRVRTARAIVSTHRIYRPELSIIAAHLFRAGGERIEAYATAYAMTSALAGGNSFAQAADVLALIERWARADSTDENDVAYAYLHRARSACHYYALEYEAALEHMVRARTLFERAGMTVDAGRVALAMANIYFFLDRLARAEELVDEVATHSPHPVLWAHIWHTRAELAQLRCDLAGAIEAQRRSSAVKANALEFRADILFATLAGLLAVNGELEEAMAMHAHARTIAADSTLLDLNDYDVQMATVTACVRGDFDGALRHANEWVVATRARADKWRGTAASAFVAACVAATGTTAEAERAVADAMRAYREIPHDELTTWWAIRAAEALLRGRGMIELADQYGGMLGDRQRAIAAAFTR